MSYGTNRYVCTVLDEMREQLKVVSGNNLQTYKEITAMMIEELQTLVNRMESALGDNYDIQRMYEEKKKLKNELIELENEVKTKKERK